MYRIAAVGAAALVVTLAMVPAAHSTTNEGYQVAIIRCPGAGPNVYLDYPDTYSAVSQYGSSVAWQWSHTSTTAQVRYTRILSGNATENAADPSNRNC